MWMYLTTTAICSKLPRSDALLASMEKNLAVLIRSKKFLWEEFTKGWHYLILYARSQVYSIISGFWRDEAIFDCLLICITTEIDQGKEIAPVSLVLLSFLDGLLGKYFALLKTTWLVVTPWELGHLAGVQQSLSAEACLKRCDHFFVKALKASPLFGRNPQVLLCPVSICIGDSLDDFVMYTVQFYACRV